MEKLMDYVLNNLVTVGVVFVVCAYLIGCSGLKTVRKPPALDPVLIVDALFPAIQAKFQDVPEAKAVVKKILAEIKTKIPLIDDGQITINDAFTAILVVTPTEYKPAVILLKVAFNSIYGDYGVEIPEDHKERIKTLKKVIKLLEVKLGALPK